MANLDARTDSFISLLIDISGRARPEDINGVPAPDAAALLQAYATAHADLGLVFDGQVLTYGSPAPAPTPAPTPAPEPVPVAPAPAPVPQEAWAPAPVEYAPPAAEPPQWQAPVEVAPAAFVPDSELPAWMFDGAPAAPASPPAVASFDPAPAFEPAPPVPAHEAVFAGVPTPAPIDSMPAVSAPAPVAGDYGVPQAPAPGGYYGVSDAAPPEYAAGAVADYAPVGDFTPSGASATMDYVMATPVGPAPVPTRVNGLWWLAVLFFGAPGAFVAWLVNRGKTGAKTFLWVGIALVVLSILLTVASIALFGLAAGVGQ